MRYYPGENYFDALRYLSYARTAASAVSALRGLWGPAKRTYNKFSRFASSKNLIRNNRNFWRKGKPNRRRFRKRRRFNRRMNP